MSQANTWVAQIRQKPWLPYVAPFVIFLLLTEPARFFPDFIAYLYIIKTILVGSLLWYWRDKYAEDFSQNMSANEWLMSFACGLLVLIIWIVPEHYFYQFGEGAGFNPYTLADTQAGVFGLIGIRIIGAALVVPIMEELFWRSFIMRYLIDPEFRSIPIGSFTWLSFFGVAILFGLEHHRIVVGIIAGLLYGALLVWQKNLKGVVFAHAITNLGLGVYVVLTENWMFW